MQQPKIFFSYSRDDGDFVLKLAQELRAEGIPLWLDQLDIAAGERWDLAVEEALQSCATQIIVLSPSSVGSQNVMDEVSFALEEHKQVIPVVCQECEVPFRLRRVQRIDFAADYDRGFKKLLAALSLEGKSKPADAGPAGAKRPAKAKQAAGAKRAHAEEPTARAETAAPKARKKGRPLLKIVGLVAVAAVGYYGYTMLQGSSVPTPVPPSCTGAYMDQGDGTVLACATNLIWLKDAGCLKPPRVLAGSMEAVEIFNSGGISGCANYAPGTYSDWRLPTRVELVSLIDPDFETLTNAAGDAMWSEGDAFSDAAPDGAYYWTSTTDPNQTGQAWAMWMNMNGGEARHGFVYLAESYGANTWPVRESR